MYFANITTLSEKALAELEQLDPHIIGLAETHIPANKDKKAFKRLTHRRPANRAKYTTPASPSPISNSGTNGGTAVLPRNYLSTTKVAPELWKNFHKQSPQVTRHDLAACALHTRFGPILVCSGYALKEDYQDLLKGVAAVSRNGKTPFILAADFNVPAQEVQTCWALEQLQAVTFSPTNCTETCFSGSTANGTSIDYVVCSKILAPYIGVIKRIADTPWSPHFALWFYVNLESDSILTDVPVRPKGFKDLPDGTVPPSGHITLDEAKLHRSYPYLSCAGDADDFTPGV